MKKMKNENAFVIFTFFLFILKISISNCDSIHSFPFQFIQINANDRGLTFDGIGALSAGASSRLLIDYNEPYRSQILDYLFLPNFGASLHILKVEIGGDTQSTDGTEPSHMHYPNDVDCNRGYEWWLVHEAKKRNPSILVYALSWGVPGWVGNGNYFSQDNINYQIQFLKCARDNQSIHVDYIGIWNERSWGSVEYIKSYRKQLDSAGFKDIQIVLPDGFFSDNADFFKYIEQDPQFSATIPIIGVHYPCLKPSLASKLGKKYWASEDYSTVADWSGAGCWGRTLNQNFVKGNMTSTIAWSLIWSVFDDLPYYGNGLMYAYEPWSGHYEVNSPIWTSAHTCQFTQPGWAYLLTKNGGSGLLNGGGSYVTFVPPTNQSEITLVIETLHGDCHTCAGVKTTSQNLMFQLSGFDFGSNKNLHFWSTNETHAFIYLGIIPLDGSTNQFSISISPDSIYTISSLKGQKKGNHPTPPPSKSFPLPYSQKFAGLKIGTMAPYLSDQGGSFAISKDLRSPSAGNVLQQVVIQNPGPNQWVANPNPITLIGDASWTNYNVTIVGRNDGGAVSTSYLVLCGRIGPFGTFDNKFYPNGYCFQVNGTGTWAIYLDNKEIFSAALSHFDVTQWHDLTLSFTPTLFQAVLDGVQMFKQNIVAGTKGRGAFGSGWHIASFSEITFVPN